MDPIRNPFSPGAGSPPPELVGRETILADIDTLLGRVKIGKPEKSLLLTGLRGVGKTVLLNEVERKARAVGYRIISLEAHENKSLGALLAPELKRILYDIDRLAGAGDKARRGLAILRSFVGSIKVSVGELDIGLDIDPEVGSADSGDIEHDLPNLFVATAEAAQERNASIIVLIDEIQYFNSKELGALIMAMHKIQQKQLPMTLVAAGLPVLPGLAGDSKSYAERLFAFPPIGALNRDDAFRAIADPAQKEGVSFTDNALSEIFRLTKGYPYFLQEWGYQCWKMADASPITLDDVRNTTPTVINRLDENFFRVRFDRLIPSEKKILFAMAQLGPGEHRTGDISAKLGVKLNSIGPARATLIKKGMIYSPAHGDMAFTVPLFDEFMLRMMK